MRYESFVGISALNFRPKFNVVKEISLGSLPTMTDAQKITDVIFSSFVAEASYTPHHDLIIDASGGRGDGEVSFSSSASSIDVRCCHANTLL